jgi:hypothetical protein
MGTQYQVDTDGKVTSGAGRIMLTPEGGIAVRLTNKTGVNSIKGTVVRCSTGTDNAFEVHPIADFDPIGVVYESGIADGQECWVVFNGRCEVLVQDGIAPARENWVGTSTVTNGRAWFGGVPVPPTDARHFQEIGHCLETKLAGVGILCFIMLHFN